MCQINTDPMKSQVRPLAICEMTCWRKWKVSFKACWQFNDKEHSYWCWYCCGTAKLFYLFDDVDDDEKWDYGWQIGQYDENWIYFLLFVSPPTSLNLWFFFNCSCFCHCRCEENKNINNKKKTTFRTFGSNFVEEFFFFFTLWHFRLGILTLSSRQIL